MCFSDIYEAYDYNEVINDLKDKVESIRRDSLMEVCDYIRKQSDNWWGTSRDDLVSEELKKMADYFEKRADSSTPDEIPDKAINDKANCSMIQDIIDNFEIKDDDIKLALETAYFRGLDHADNREEILNNNLKIAVEFAKEHPK